MRLKEVRPLLCDVVKQKWGSDIEILSVSVTVCVSDRCDSEPPT